jgi:hypothetical protein
MKPAMLTKDLLTSGSRLIGYILRKLRWATVSFFLRRRIFCYTQTLAAAAAAQALNDSPDCPASTLEEPGRVAYFGTLATVVPCKVLRFFRIVA